MVLSRSTISFLLLAISAGGCKQSLFDANVDDVDAAAGDRPDADPDAPDAGTPPAECVEPCVGNALAEFDSAQGGTNGRWSYVSDARNPLGTSYADMTFGTHLSLPAWVGAAAQGPPAILSCGGASAGDPSCAGAEDTLMFAPTGNGPGLADPALTYELPSTGEFRIYGSFVSPETAQTGVQHRLLISRNGRHDALVHDLFATSHSPAGFGTRFEGVQGDRIRVAILGNTATPVLVGMDLYVTDMLAPGQCQVTTLFDDLSNRCVGGTSFTDFATSPDSAPTGVPGAARLFEEGDYLEYAGPVMDYSGDFTIQFWVNLASMPWTTEAIYADWNCVVGGGVAMFRNGTNLTVAGFHHDPTLDLCAEPSQLFVQTAEPSNDAWHFIRLSRDTAAESVKLCIDGQLRGQASIPGDVVMTSDEPPRLGRNVVYNPAYFRGSMADVRVYTRTLPCPTLP